MAAVNTKSFAEGLMGLVQQAAGLMGLPDADLPFLQALQQALVERSKAPAGAGGPQGAPPPGGPAGPGGPPPGGGMPMSPGPGGGPAGPPAGVRPLAPMGNPDEIRRLVGAATQ